MAYKRNANNILVFTVIEYIGVVLRALKLWPVYKTLFYQSACSVDVCVLLFKPLFTSLSVHMVLYFYKHHDPFGLPNIGAL